MALDSINEVYQNGINGIQMATGERTTPYSPILQFADNANNNGIGDKEPSEAKLKTEAFKYEIMSKLDIPQSKKSKNVKYYLGKLVEAAQELNGVQKNNLKPKGTQEQNKLYNLRIQERVAQMKDYAEMVGCGLSIVQDTKTGLYKLNINNKLYDIPERKVEIVNVETEDGVELLPEIVD